MVPEVQENRTQIGQIDEDVATYRPVSRMAVVGLLVGIVSFLALAHPILWCVPPLAILFCLWGLRNIRRSKGSLSGHGIAVVGILLALFFAGGALANFSVRRMITYRQGAMVADRWIQLVEEGAIYHAHQWVLPWVTREAPGVPLEGFYDSDEGKSSFDQFVREDPGLTLSQIGPEDRIELLGCQDVTITRRNRFVDFRYRLVRPNDVPLDFGLLIRRFTDPETSQHSWTARPYMPEDESDTP
jgi:hypothetical protein